jgi:hypothetical protein
MVSARSIVSLLVSWRALRGPRVSAVSACSRAPALPVRRDATPPWSDRLHELLVRLAQLVLEGPGSRSHRGWRRAWRIPISWLLPLGSAMHPCAPRAVRLGIGFASRAQSEPVDAHPRVLGALARRPVFVTPADCQNLSKWIALRVAARTVRPGEVGVSTSSLLIGASAPGRPDRAVSARRAHERAERKPHRLDAREAVAV